MQSSGKSMKSSGAIFTKVSKCAVLLAALCAAVYTPQFARAERITPADLLNGVLPGPSSFVRVEGSVHGVTNGQDYHGQYLTMDNDSKCTNFNLSEANTEDGCGCDFTLSPVAVLNTYSIRVASDTASDVSRAPKKWAIYGSSDQTTWTLLTLSSSATLTKVVEGKTPILIQIQALATSIFHQSSRTRLRTRYRPTPLPRS